VTKRKRASKTNSDDGSETGDYDEEDDGADADGESNDGTGIRPNSASRRRSAQDSGERAMVSKDKRRTKDGEDARRHSMAV